MNVIPESKLKYYSYNEYSEDGGEVITLSEQDIIDQYFDYWYSRMCAKFGKEHVDANYNKQNCIDDWVVVHWAWEVDNT